VNDCPGVDWIGSVYCPLLSNTGGVLLFSASVVAYWIFLVHEGSRVV
jgi:hypothetical protein